MKDLFIFKVTKTVYLKNGLVFRLKSLLDILTLKEVVIDDEYQCRGVRVDDKDKIIIDVGAGFGDFSIMTAKKFPEAKIYAFEPDPDYFSLLLENIRLNNAKNVYPYLQVVNSLQQIFKIIREARCNFMKLDCEGCEYKIFKKNRTELKKIRKIVLEYHEDENNKVNVLMKLFKTSKFHTKVYPRTNVSGIGILCTYRVKG